MIYIKGKFLSAVEKDNKGYKYLEVAIENEKSLRYPHFVKCSVGYDYLKDIDKNGIMTLGPLYVSSWSDRVKKFSPVGVNYSYSSKS